MNEVQQTTLLERYSRGEISAIELRCLMGGITFGVVLIELSKRDLPLPRAPRAGREDQLREARALLFPRVA